LLDSVESGKRVDSQAKLMAELLPEAPPGTVCDPVAEYEHAVKGGQLRELNQCAGQI